MLKKMYRLLSYKSLCGQEFFWVGVERARKRRIFVQLPSPATSHAHSWLQLLPKLPLLFKISGGDWENTERSLARKIVRFEVSLGTGSVFCRIALWDFVTVFPTCTCNLVIATVGNSRDSDPKQFHSAMRQNTDPVSRGSWPIHLYRRLTGGRMVQKPPCWLANNAVGPWKERWRNLCFSCPTEACVAWRFCRVHYSWAAKPQKRARITAPTLSCLRTQPKPPCYPS